MDADREAEQAAQLQAFLNMLNDCEGKPGYNQLFGYKPFDSYDKHPNVLQKFANSNGVIQNTTAAGRYQINYPTWLNFINACGVHDFSPASQDACAKWLIDSRANALEDVYAGRLQSAIDKCSGIWASLPASSYPQPKRTYAFAENAFTQAGGVLA